MVMEAAGAVAGAVGAFTDLFKAEKAKLVVVEGSPVGGKTELECMFNPTDYRLQRTVTIPRDQTPATPGGTPSYGGATGLKLSMSLFFNEFHLPEGDVTPKIGTLLDWMKPTPESRDTSAPTAPVIQFKWGGNPQLTAFKGFLTSLSVTYSVFRKDGTPIEAKAEISIDEKPEPESGQNPTSRAANSHRAHTMIEGDSLQSVAYRLLGKATYWRAIADLNDIDDPLRLEPGTVLLIPSRADAAKHA